MKELYEKIIEELNEDEKKHSSYLLFIKGDFIKYSKQLKKKNLCLNIKIKEKRKSEFIAILDNLSINYEICTDNKYYTIIELNKNHNYVVLDYVVNSHVMIPESFLRMFGYKSKDGYELNYIDFKDKEIKKEKTKEYGSVYGYYDKYIEEELSKNFEGKIGVIRSNLYEFYKGNIKEYGLPSKDFILDFVDITFCRNPKMLDELNKNSISNILVGGFTHSYLLDKVINGNFPHIFDNYEINILLNKTKSNFIICDSMLSYIKTDNENYVIVLPITPKICIVLMRKEYIKKYIKGGELYYLELDDIKEVNKINQRIYLNAVANNENVIGSKEELEKLKLLYKESKL